MPSLRSSPSLRLLVVFGITLILLVPMTLIENIISEREYRRMGVVDEISSKWGFSQTLMGPILQVPYTVSIREEEKSGKSIVERSRMVTKNAYFLPKSLNITGKIMAETRYRSIFETVVYTAALNVQGEFGQLDIADVTRGEDVVAVHWDQAVFSLGVSDMRGIDSALALDWGGEEVPVESGPVSDAEIGSAVNARVMAPEGDTNVAFSLPLELKGSGGLMFTPAGRTTTVSLQGNWPGPSFDGEFLPDTREVTDADFSAQWEVLHLNRSYPQQWSGSNAALSSAHFGVNLLLPVSQYQESMRTTKYALLFILLTFTAVFLTEILTGRTLHPVNYLLVGLALVVFYLLLLALSEHVTFDVSYAIASLAVISSIAGYTRAVLRSNRWSMLIALTLFILYGFYYILLQLEDYALLVGSFGIFLILALLMFLTRKIDWYGAFGKKNFEFSEEPLKPAK